MTTFTKELSSALFDAITLKYNENHDEQGRFSSGGGGGSSGGDSGGSNASLPKTYGKGEGGAVITSRQVLHNGKNSVVNKLYGGRSDNRIHLGFEAHNKKTGQTDHFPRKDTAMSQATSWDKQG